MKLGQHIENLGDILKDISISAGLESPAAALTIALDYPPRDRYVCIHLLPKPDFRFWGHKRDHYDGAPLHDFGLGPLVLVCSWGI